MNSCTISRLWQVAETTRNKFFFLNENKVMHSVLTRPIFEKDYSVFNCPAQVLLSTNCPREKKTLTQSFWSVPLP